MNSPGCPCALQQGFSIGFSILLSSIALPGPLWAGDRSSGFGRWQSSAQMCERNLAAGQLERCSNIQLDQQLEGMLNVRFISPGKQRDTSNTITFVGMVNPSQQALRCSQGRCELGNVNNLRAEISSISESSFDGRGLAEGLPKAWPASGSCVLERNLISCEGKAITGERFKARASF